MTPRLALPALLLAAAPMAPVALDAQATDSARAVVAPTACTNCVAWNAPERPFRIHGNTWYVGTNGLSAILVTSPAGHVLIDGGLTESAPRILASIRELGFRVEDVRLILNSHAHYDHAAGIAPLQVASGAEVAAHPWSAAFMRAGRSIAGDPQFGIDIPYEPVTPVREITDGDTLRVGPLAMVAHFTGGHTPGGTTWTWRSCEGTGAAERCYDMAYVDSQTPVSADDFRFTSNTSYPSAIADFERGFARIEGLRCDVLLTPHPSASEMFERRTARDGGKADAFRDAGACRRLAAQARQRLARRIATEREAR